jgi:cytochrome c peroxidase
MKPCLSSDPSTQSSANLRLAGLAGVILPTLALTALTPLQAEEAPKPAEIRALASSLIKPLPEKMPGAEKDSEALIELGKTLFFEKQLSANNSQSCNSCHSVDKQRGGVDNEPTSPGAFGKRGGRNSPTVLNAGFHLAQFWDGRAPSLEAQAKGPILNPIEMAIPNEAEAVRKIKALRPYQRAFAKAFPDQKDPITYDNIANAIAAFERTLVTHDRFDEFLKGNDTALSTGELQGLQTFVSTGCVSCHNGPLLGANSYQKMGAVNPYANTEDLGREAVTKSADDHFKFKVPSLRNIALTAPYFHDGKAATLDDAVRQMAWLQLGRKLEDAQVKSIVTFLQALTDKPRSVAQNSK